MDTKGVFMSNTVEWSTPEDLYKLLDNEFHFTLDVCATDENAKCARYFTKDDNGLAQDWLGDICWMNPPYGREIGKWMEKAYQTFCRGGVVVCLIPSRTDTQWWHDFVVNKASEVRFIKGRLKFGGCQHSAPFPSVVAVYDGRAKKWAIMK